MLSCLIGLIIVVIVAVIILYVAETALAAIFPLPPPIMTLIRLLVGLLVLLWFLQCIGILGGNNFTLAHGFNLR